MSSILKEAATLHEELTEHSLGADNLGVAQRAYVHELQTLRATMKMEVRKVVDQDTVRIGPIYTRKSEWDQEGDPPYPQMFHSLYSKKPGRRVTKADPFEKKPSLLYMDRPAKWSELGIRCLMLGFVSPYMTNWVECLNLCPRLPLESNTLESLSSLPEESKEDSKAPRIGFPQDAFDDYFRCLHELTGLKCRIRSKREGVPSILRASAGSGDSPVAPYPRPSLPKSYSLPFYYTRTLVQEPFVSLLREMVNSITTPMPVAVGSSLSMDFLTGITVEPGRQQLVVDVCVYTPIPHGVYAFLPVLFLDMPEWYAREDLTGEYVGPEWQEGAAKWAGMMSHLLLYMDFRSQQLTKPKKPSKKLLASLPRFSLPAHNIRGLITDGLRFACVTWTFDPQWTRTKPTPTPYSIDVEGVYRLWVREDHTKLENFINDALWEGFASPSEEGE